MAEPNLQPFQLAVALLFCKVSFRHPVSMHSLQSNRMMEWETYRLWRNTKAAAIAEPSGSSLSQRCRLPRNRASAAFAESMPREPCRTPPAVRR
jgi:hypothetical protein